MVIDTLTTKEFLVDKGYSENQAEGFIRTLQRLSFDEFATKGDINALQVEMNHQLHSLEQRLTIRLGGMIMALGAILITIKYFG